MQGSARLRLGLLWIALFTVACGGEGDGGGGTKPGPGPSGGGKKAGGGTQNTPAENSNAGLDAKLAELKGEMDRVKKLHVANAKEIAEVDKELDALLSQQREERSELGDNSVLLRQARAARSDEKRALAAVERYRKKVEGLGGTGSGRHEELQALEKKLSRLRDEETEAILKQTQDNVSIGVGKVEESPVLHELLRLREIQLEWLTTTKAVRAKKPDASTRDAVNRAFRTWLAEDDMRTDIVRKILDKKKKKIPGFDFTQFRFFSMLQMYEDELDKLNIASEKKKNAALEKIVQDIRDRISRVEEQIETIKEGAGGASVTELDEATKRLKAAEKKLNLVRKQLKRWQKQLAPIDEMESRHKGERVKFETRLRDLDETRRKLAEAYRRVRKEYGELKKKAAA